MVEEVGEVFESDGAGSGEFSVITDPSAAPVVGPPLSSRGSGSDTRRTTEAGSLGLNVLLLNMVQRRALHRPVGLRA